MMNLSKSYLVWSRSFWCDTWVTKTELKLKLKQLTKNVSISIYCQRQKCSQGILVSSKVRFMWIFAGICWRGGVKWLKNSGTTDAPHLCQISWKSDLHLSRNDNQSNEPTKEPTNCLITITPGACKYSYESFPSLGLVKYRRWLCEVPSADSSCDLVSWVERAFCSESRALIWGNIYYKPHCCELTTKTLRYMRW